MLSGGKFLLSLQQILRSLTKPITNNFDMKKTLMMVAAVCAVFTLASCHSKESAYKKAYEKAQAQQTQTTTTTAPVVQQTTTTPTVTTVTPTTPANDYSNVQVRSENFSLVSGAPLKAYSVVIGSFGVKANALSPSSFP